jgi:hypothetical protein
MSLVDTQRSIEYMYDKSRISKMIRDDINSTSEIVDKINECVEALMSTYLMGPHFNQKNIYLSKLNQSHMYDAVYRVLEVAMQLPRGLTFTSLVGQTSGVIPSENITDSFKIVSSVISYMYFFGLLKITRAGDADSGMMEVIPVYVCDERIMKYIHQTQYLPPMVCAPRKLTHNKSCGYLTKENESLILKGYNHHDGDICLDSLNKFNQISYSLDIKMLTTFDEQPKNLLDTHQKEMQFSKLREDSYRIFKLLIQSGNEFHFTHKVDKRGRTYSQGFHCNTQGNSFRKSIINLAHKELVNGSFL